ncbi:MAG: DedA family protein [Syntrophomonadaceae bacterium]
MDILLTAADFVINLDHHLIEIIHRYGVWATLILFLVIFCETGLVVTPFLPGDSFLFVIGSLAASGDINIVLITIVLMTAAITGNMVNYQIGRWVGPKVFEREKSRLFKKEYLIRTHHFYERHGGKTIIISRFIPIIRTFAPFVAGISKMHYGRFAVYNLVGGTLWVLLFITGGYFFGNIPFVEQNFTMVIFGIIIISLIPGLIGVINSRRSSPEHSARSEK